MKVINHLLPFTLLLIPLIWGLYGFFKTRGVEKKIPDDKKPAGILIINSAVLYALAFNIIFYTGIVSNVGKKVAGA